jgi:nicotinamidase-related amidase
MSRKALVVIDIQNDITKHYREIIDRINDAIDWAVENGLEVVYIKHNNLSAGTRTFKPDTKGAELVPELKIASDNIFVKTKANALTSAAFSEYIQGVDINEFYITGLIQMPFSRHWIMHIEACLRIKKKLTGR